MGSGRPLTCHRSESSASGSATMNSAEDPLCGMTSGAGKFRASARAGTRVRMRCATRAIPRRSVLNVQMLRLWDDRLHFVISPVIIVSGPLSPLFQLTTATSVTSTRAPSLSRFLASPSERHTDTDHHGPSWLAVGPTGPSSVRSKIIPPHLLPGIIVACKTNGIGAAGAASLSGVLGR